MPKAIALAADLAGRSEFEGFYAVVKAIQADFVVYGDAKLLPQGASCYPLNADEDFTSMCVRLTGVRPAQRKPISRPPERIIVMGASTGGLSALETILSRFPRDCPPTIIVQHMREGFMSSVISRLDRICDPIVMAINGGESLQNGCVYIASDPACHVIFSGRKDRLGLELKQTPPISGHRPSVDMLFLSLAETRTSLPITAALLTGMGSDGAAGLLALRENGAHTIAQDMETSTVWGMPRAAIEIGGAKEILPVGKVGDSLLRESKTAARRAKLEI